MAVVENDEQEKKDENNFEKKSSISNLRQKRISRRLIQHQRAKSKSFDSSSQSNSKMMLHSSSETTPKFSINRNQVLCLANQSYNSFQSDISCSSLSSIESLLESRRENPEEILLALGFGHGNKDKKLDPLVKIPFRFFEQQSRAKGVHVNEIIRLRNQLLNQKSSTTENTSKGLSSEMTNSTLKQCTSSSSSFELECLASKSMDLSNFNQSTDQTNNDEPEIRETFETRSKNFFRKMSCLGTQINHQHHVDERENIYDEESYYLLTSFNSIDFSKDYEIRSFIGAALQTSIQCLKMSLDFYRCFLSCSVKENFIFEDSFEAGKKWSTPPPNVNCCFSSANEWRLAVKSLFQDVLEVEVMLHECRLKLKASHNWHSFIKTYVTRLKKATDRIVQIQLDLQRLKTQHH